MITITLGKEWAPAPVGRHASMLLLNDRDTGERRQCCIGVACTAAGVPDAVILHQRGLETLADAIAATDLPPYLQAMRADANATLELVGAKLSDLAHAYRQNDVVDDSLTPRARVAAINTHTEPYGFRFVLDPVAWPETV